MSGINARLFELPEHGEVVIEARRNGDVRVSDREGLNVQTITRAQTDQAARTVLSLGDGEAVPAIFARRLAFARLAQDAGFLAIDQLPGRDMPAAGAGAPATPPSSASPLSQAANPGGQRVAGRSAAAKRGR